MVLAFMTIQPATVPLLTPPTMNPAQIYARLEALVLPVLQEYQSDLTVQDRNCLSAYTGPFLLSYRATGTNLLVLGEAKEFLMADSERTPREQIERTFERKRAEVSWDYNTHFLHFDGQDFHALTRTEALALVDAHRAQVLEELKDRKSGLLPV